MKELQAIQAKLKAPKNQRNNFGKYNYRSCEDILEAVKPLCHEQNCAVLITDQMQQVGERYYVNSQATIVNSKGEERSCSGWAREADSKKGMDASQLTGATSSYARKYALNGLFAIDDTKEADATNDHQTPAKATKPKATANTETELQHVLKKIFAVKNGDELKKVWVGLSTIMHNNEAVVKAKNDMKVNLGL
jgi:hypothetical protein